MNDPTSRKAQVVRVVWPRGTSRLIGVAWLLSWTFGWVGCTGGESPAASPSSPFGPATNAARLNSRHMWPVSEHTPTAGAMYRYIVCLKIIPVTVPAGSVSRSERLWRYLDEEVVDVELLAALNRNGFRVGCGKQVDWHAVGGLLREMTGQALRQSEHWTRPGDGVPLVLNAGMPTQHIFAFNGRGELRGRDYPAGDNVLMITCRVNTDNPADVVIQAAPVVRVPQDVPRIVRTEMGMAFSHKPIMVPIDPLQFTVRVPEGHYLVIGPGAAARRSTSPGHRLLTKQTDGLRQEMLLVLVPQVYVAEVSGGGI